MKNALIEALDKMSDSEATALWEAVAQWADNQRCHVSEQDEPEARDVETLRVAETFMEAGDAAMASLADY